MEVASIKEVRVIAYKTCYLFSKNWEYNVYSDTWTKLGVFHVVKVHPYASDPEHTEWQDEPEFNLEDAYYWEMNQSGA